MIQRRGERVREAGLKPPEETTKISQRANHEGFPCLEWIHLGVKDIV
jgi:hypothetical protein